MSRPTHDNHILGELKSLEARVTALEKAKGEAGTGACICRQPPHWILKHHAGAEWAKANINIVIDHRCAHHGEKAQPSLWGRHRELELTVTWPQWESLGVHRDNI